MKRWAPFLLWLVFVVGVIVSADEGWMGSFFYRVNQVPMGDKAGHFFLIGSLAYLLNRALAWRTVPLGSWRVQWGGLIILVLITLEECSQIWIPQRSFDVLDLLANYAGILVAQFCSRSAPPQGGSSA